MFTRGVSDKETPRFFFAFRPCTVGMRVSVAGGGGGSRGSVFQTGLPFRQESGGLKTPGY